MNEQEREQERLDRAIRAALGDLVAAAPRRHDVPARPERRWTPSRSRVLVAAAAGLTAAAGIVAVVAVTTRTATPTDDAVPRPGVTVAPAEPASTPAPSTTTSTSTPSTAPPSTLRTTTTVAPTTAAAPTSTAAPTAGPLQRIQFRRGTNDAAMDGTLVPGTTDRFVLEAAEGQRMIVDVDTQVAGVSVSIAAPDGTPLAADESIAAVDLPTDGDYLVEVRPSRTGGDYTITFYIM
jgi:hypothetical protein